MVIEDFVHHVETNHVYAERTLQPSIAAGLFFLFQDAVVRDVISSTNTTSSTGSSTGSSAVDVLAFLSNI